MTEVISPKRLIEVAMPLDAINAASAHEKSVRQGHPSSLHLWWARRPLATARAVIYGQLVHDPEDLWRCQNPGAEPSAQNRSAWTKARTRHFKILEDLVRWENTTNEAVLETAREAIREAWRQTCELNKDHPQASELFDPMRMPGLHDPFAGGGAIPLEAQRLGLQAYASDLNPVAVLINKAMIEIPPRFAGRAAVNPTAREGGQLLVRRWSGVEGLAEDVRYFGEWMRAEALKRIGALYPGVLITPDMSRDRPDLKPYVGRELKVIAWLWARTVKSPNPAFAEVDVPLVSGYWLATGRGKEAYVQPVVDAHDYRFTVKTGRPTEVQKVEAGTKLARGANFECLMSGAPIAADYIKAEGVAGRMGAKLMAIVAEGDRGRVYLDPLPEHEDVARQATPPWWPESVLPDDPRSHWTPPYGLTTYGHLFTPRQLVALTTFCDLVGEAIQRARVMALQAGHPDDPTPLRDGGSGAVAYAEAVGVYLSFALSKQADLGNSLCGWEPDAQCPRHLFSRQGIPMIWDYAEGNPLGSSSGAWAVCVDGLVKAFTKAFKEVPSTAFGFAAQADAHVQTLSAGKFVSTDPPYYDNIGYADLSDFFYVWLRRSLRDVFPDVFATVMAPKSEELVAIPYRHGGKEQAEAFFLDGMTRAMNRLAEQAHPASPLTIYYAFKQSETKRGEGTSSTGWETFLDAVIRAGLAITGTWPMRTENSSRMVGQGSNALASSIVLVCRQRPASALPATRREFVRALNRTLPDALDQMTRSEVGDHSPVAPVDLSQAIIGPGMAVFSQYGAVLEADGSPMSVQTALKLINRFLTEADFDADTQFCLSWFEQHGWDPGPYGDAETLAKAKGTSVSGVNEAGVLESGGGHVRLFRWREYAAGWEPSLDARLPVWEALHQLVRAYEQGGDIAASSVLAAIGVRAEAARQLAYRLHTLCERKGWAEEARAYNQVVTGWGAIEEEAARIPGPRQDALFGIAEGSS